MGNVEVVQVVQQCYCCRISFILNCVVDVGCHTAQKMIVAMINIVMLCRVFLSVPGQSLEPSVLFFKNKFVEL